ncbi:MAG TPA: PAS domain-containing protein, partial [Longimicrobium sp.]|nr:PAS domain-containing protein [Longimicrobium sp.]
MVPCHPWCRPCADDGSPCTNIAEPPPAAPPPRIRPARLSYPAAYVIPAHAQHQHTARHAPAQPGNGLIDAIPLIVWAAAPHGRLLYVNRHWTIFTGQEEGEALRDGTEAHVHPDDRACVALAWKQGLPGGEAEGAPFHFEFRLRGRHGEYRWHLARCVPERDAAGAVARWVGTAMDVHEREAADPATRDAERSLLLARADAALAEADMERRRLATLIEHLPVGVSLAEAPSGQLLVSNAAVDRIWGGAPQSEEIAEYSADYAGYHPESGRRYESHEWPLARALVNGEIVVDELVEVVRPDGSRRMVSISAAPVRGADGQIVAGAVTSMDVTEREELLVAATTFRAELEDGNATLREQALELELSNQQLQEQATELELQAEELQATAAHLEEAMESAERARRAAQAAEARLHSVFAQTPAAVAVTIGPEHRYTLVNARGA